MSLRFDRLATLGVVDPVIRRRSNRKDSIPILMYHSIADTDENGVHPYYRTATTPSAFKLHMQYLRDQGYKTISLHDAVEVLRNAAPPAMYAVVTFDDGFSDFYKHAFPVLVDCGFTATMFLPTAYIGAATMQFKGKDCLTWAEVRELRKHNIIFGSHTVTHPQLSTLDEGAVYLEVSNSKKAIEDNLGEEITSFSYPYAFPDGKTAFVQTLRNALVKTGYHQGVSTRIGLARHEEDPYFLRRLPVNALDDLALFGAKLRGSYDWLRTFQYGAKLLASWN